MSKSKEFWIRLAKLYLEQCRNGDHRHAHGLDKIINNGIVSFADLDLKESELQDHLLELARALASRCVAHADLLAALDLHGMLNCKGSCQGVITHGSAGIAPGFLELLLRKQALRTLQTCLDSGTETDLRTAAQIIREYKLTHLEINLDPAVIKLLSADDSL
ncbi:MAG: hypothetical protein PHS79_05620 [Patescibacteria group bacterium]|nr:hypothetical protein [Patescibacteria group bacterium]